MHFQFQNSYKKDKNATKKFSNSQIRYAKNVENNISKKMHKYAWGVREMRKESTNAKKCRNKPIFNSK